MKLFHAAIIVAFIVAMALLVPFGPSANARSGLSAPSSPRGLHYTFHPRNLLGRHHMALANRNFGRWPFYGSWPLYGGLYGGLYAVPPYGFDNDLTSSVPAPEQVIYVPMPPTALTCKHSEETVTVPAEAGGTKQLTITRC